MYNVQLSRAKDELMGTSLELYMAVKAVLFHPWANPVSYTFPSDATAMFSHVAGCTVMGRSFPACPLREWVTVLDLLPFSGDIIRLIIMAALEFDQVCGNASLWLGSLTFCQVGLKQVNPVYLSKLLQSSYFSVYIKFWSRVVLCSIAYTWPERCTLVELGTLLTPSPAVSLAFSSAVRLSVSLLTSPL